MRSGKPTHIVKHLKFSSTTKEITQGLGFVKIVALTAEIPHFRSK